MTRILALLLLGSALAPLAASAQPQNPSFNLANRSAQPIRELFATPAGEANWGQNRLTAGPVSPGASFAVRLPQGKNCIYDLRVVYADGVREQRRAVNVCSADDVAFVGAAKAATGKPAGDVSFHLVNHDRQMIDAVYAVGTVAPEAAGGARPAPANLLEKGGLAPGAAVAVSPPRGQGCNFELRVVFADRSSKSRKMDLCATSELVVP